MKRIFKITLAFFLLFALSQVTRTVSAAVSFEGGNGTAANPYQVSTPDQLNEVQKYLSSHFIQINDIDMTTFDFGLWGWTPIGTNTSWETRFRGSYDGGNYKIKGLKYGVGSSYIGMFGYVENAPIKNVHIEDSNISTGSLSSNYVGGIIGYATGSNATISNCSYSGDISFKWFNSSSQATYRVGGIVGATGSGVTITNCSNSGSIFSDAPLYSYTGGIVGSFNGSQLSGCRNSGKISSHSINDSSYAGGIAGFGDVSDSVNTGKIDGYSYIDSVRAGGITGSTSIGGTVKNCYNTGYVSAINYDQKFMAAAGGIAGDASNIINCFNTGNIVTSSSGDSYTGGIAGIGGTMSNCYSTGDIACDKGSTIRLGGLAGTLSTGGNCYWNSDAVHRQGSTNLTSKKGVGASSAVTKSYKASEMKLNAFVDLLNENSGTNKKWYLDGFNINKGYPIFENQSPVTINEVSGLYYNALDITFTKKDGNTEIYYTLDDSTPTESSDKYDSPIRIDKDVKLKVIIISENEKSSVYEFSYTFAPKPVSAITVTGYGGETTITSNGGTLQMLADVQPPDAADKTVTWSVIEGTGSAVIDSVSGVLTAVSNGTVTVRATANDKSGVYGERTITISGQIVPVKLVSNISVTGYGGEQTITSDGGTLQMLAYVQPHDATDKTVTWSVIESPDSGSAVIDSVSGVLTAVSNGMVAVKATANDESGVYGTYVITISGQREPVKLVSSITVTGYGGKTTITSNGGTLQMLANVQPDDAADKTVTWSVINGSGSASIDSSTGILKATSNGTVTVRATANDASGVYGERTITISGQSVPVKLVSTITVTGAGGATAITSNGATLQMAANVLPEDAGNKSVTWSVINGSGSASINSSTGILKATSNGTVTVRATANDASGVYGERTITISGQSVPVKLVSTITVTGAGGATAITSNGATLQMAANVLPEDAGNKSVTWSVINGSGSASINSSTGILKATSNGTVTVRATANDASGVYGECTITISGQGELSIHKDYSISNHILSGSEFKFDLKNISNTAKSPVVLISEYDKANGELKNITCKSITLSPNETQYVELTIPTQNKVKITIWTNILHMTPIINVIDTN